MLAEAFEAEPGAAGQADRQARFVEFAGNDKAVEHNRRLEAGPGREIMLDAEPVALIQCAPAEFVIGEEHLAEIDCGADETPGFIVGKAVHAARGEAALRDQAVRGRGQGQQGGPGAVALLDQIAGAIITVGLAQLPGPADAASRRSWS